MPLAGHAFLALWNDVLAEREAEYDRWHTFQHVPERVAVPGFLGARRYVNRARSVHRHFTLYELASLDALDSPEYRELVDDPTPWSASMRPDLANFLRAPCAIESTSGTGIGAAVAIARLDATIARGALDELGLRAHAIPRVNGVHVGRRHASSNVLAFGSPPGAPVRSFERVLLIEALDRTAARTALDEVAPALGLAAVDSGADVYDLSLAYPGHDPDERLGHRRASWLAPKTSRQ
jgi:hypothetical protein